MSNSAKRMSGFSTVELVIAVGIFLVMSAVAIPNSLRMLQSYRAGSSVRSIASQLALAKMLAAQDFTQTQVSCNFATNSCQLQACTTKGVNTCTAFTSDTHEGSSLILPQGLNFGFGSASTPAGTQTAIGNTTPVVFNSRGIPVDNTNAATGNDALYVTDQAGDTYAVTVYASGKIALWQYVAGAWRAR